jgi:outer membrane protein assembly factor BamB
MAQALVPEETEDTMRTANPRTTVLAGCVLLLGTASAGAQDWPQWRGPHRDARVTGFEAPKTWPKELTRKWRTPVGNGVATPALVGDKLYVFTREGNEEVVRCLNAATGKEQWQQKYTADPVRRPADRFPGPRSSPVVADGKVVTLGVDGTVSCFDAVTGNNLWRKIDFKGSVPQFFTSCSPLVVDGLVIVQLGGEKKGAIVAFDQGTGDIRWQRDADGTSYASPVVVTLDGVKMIVAETSGHIVGVEAGNGKALWDTPFKVRYNACTPVVEGQTIIYSGGGGGTHAVKIDKKGDTFAARELWNNADMAVQYDTPVIKDGLVFGLSERDRFFCLNAETGKTAWSAPKAGPAGATAGSGQPGGGGRGGRGGIGGGGYGSIVDAGSVLIALTPSSELLVFEPSAKEFKVLARYKVADTPTHAYPIVAGNRLFIKDQDAVTLWTID